VAGSGLAGAAMLDSKDEFGSHGRTVAGAVISAWQARTRLLAEMKSQTVIAPLPRNLIWNVTSDVDWNNPRAVAALIDHTLLKPEATQQDIIRVCEEAGCYHFASVCINPCWVTLAREILDGTPVRVCSVISFPLGANDMRTKIAEADLALNRGAKEIDMVQNIGALKSREYSLLYKEIGDLAEIAQTYGGFLKVILETCLLTDEEKVTACRIAQQSKADFVKTSTGFSTGGATITDVHLMRQTVGPQMGVKASGGIRTLEHVRQMVAAGANRIGASAGVAILKEVESGIASQPPVSASGEVNPY
jgi:deoxyribose-phosphate aldolase